MDLHFQDLQWVIDRATKEFKTNKKRRISSLFRDLRTNKSYSFFGDYFILWAIAKTMQNLDIPRKRKPMWNGCRNSQEFKQASGHDRRWWLNTLLGDLK